MRCCDSSHFLPCSPSQVESLVGLLTQLSTLVASNGGMKPKQWGKVVALLAKDAAKVGEEGWPDIKLILVIC